MEIFSFDEKLQNYPNQQDILDRISPSLVSESNYAKGCTGLHLAANFGFLKSILYFLSKGMNVDMFTDNNGWTALMLAALTGHLEGVQLLLDQSADINKADNYGWTALMYAIQKNYPEVVQLFVNNRADPNKKDNKGKSAIDIARDNGNADIIKILENAKSEL